MNIESGKFYRTRDGRKAEVVGRRSEMSGQSPWIGVINGRVLVAWFADGSTFWPPTKPCGSDLIEEWREPRTLTVEVVMTSGCGYVAVPPGHPWKGALARQRVTLTEGVFCEEHPQ